MPKAAWELDVCEGCTLFGPNGELTMVGAHKCGISAAKIGPLLINSEYPEIAAAVDQCEGVVEQRIPKRGLRGLLAGTKTVNVCGAVTTEQLKRIFKDQIDWHQSINANGEA